MINYKNTPGERKYKSVETEFLIATYFQQMFNSKPIYSFDDESKTQNINSQLKIEKYTVYWYITYNFQLKFTISIFLGFRFIVEEINGFCTENFISDEMVQHTVSLIDSVILERDL